MKKKTRIYSIIFICIFVFFVTDPEQKVPIPIWAIVLAVFLVLCSLVWIPTLALLRKTGNLQFILEEVDHWVVKSLKKVIVTEVQNSIFKCPRSTLNSINWKFYLKTRKNIKKYYLEWGSNWIPQRLLGDVEDSNCNIAIFLLVFDLSLLTKKKKFTFK